MGSSRVSSTSRMIFATSHLGIFWHTSIWAVKRSTFQPIPMSRSFLIPTLRHTFPYENVNSVQTQSRKTSDPNILSGLSKPCEMWMRYHNPPHPSQIYCQNMWDWEVVRTLKTSVWIVRTLSDGLSMDCQNLWAPPPRWNVRTLWDPLWVGCQNSMKSPC